MYLHQCHYQTQGHGPRMRVERVFVGLNCKKGIKNLTTVLPFQPERACPQYCHLLAARTMSPPRTAGILCVLSPRAHPHAVMPTITAPLLLHPPPFAPCLKASPKAQGCGGLSGSEHEKWGGQVTAERGVKVVVLLAW